MIKEALEFLATIQTPRRPVTHKVEGQDYQVKADGTLGDAIREFDPRPERPALTVATLSGLVAAYKAGIDALGDRKAFVIHDPFKVSLADLDYDDHGKRQVYVIAKHVEPKPFPFDTLLEPEPFLLAFRAGFLYDDNAVIIQQICSSIASGAGVAIADDGVSQEVTVKSGTITKAAVTLPQDGVALIPLRTFRDANPAQAKFLLRMKGVKDGLPKVGLFEIDGMWQSYLVLSIRKFLEQELPDAVIIS